MANSSNSINKQILKGLLYYYSLAKKFPKIKTISIIRNKTNEHDYIYKINHSYIIQPIISKNITIFCFNKNIIKELFNESERGNVYRIVLSYWLKAIASTERYYKFDHLWRAFNRIYLYESNQIKDLNGLIEMRKFILNNADSFLDTILITNAISYDDLRKFRWRQLILNDFDTYKKTDAFRNFVFRYSDERIMNLFKDILPYREEFLKNVGLYGDVVSHINQDPIIKDGELVTLLSIKYAYFVRNKMFHGEIPDSTFKIYNDNIDNEIDKLNEILSTLIYEILNSDILRR